MGRGKIIPLGSYVLINNPLFGKTDVMEKELEKLPPAERENYLRNNLGEIWSDIEILEVGPNCTQLKKGDRGITDGTLTLTGILVGKNEYLMIRESQFIGRWA